MIIIDFRLCLSSIIPRSIALSFWSNGTKNKLYLNFDEYRKVSEPHKRERAEAWRIAIGLQAVDGLQVLEYLKQTAR